MNHLRLRCSHMFILSLAWLLPHSVWSQGPQSTNAINAASESSPIDSASENVEETSNGVTSDSDAPDSSRTQQIDRAVSPAASQPASAVVTESESADVPHGQTTSTMETIKLRVEVIKLRVEVIKLVVVVGLAIWGYRNARSLAQEGYRNAFNQWQLKNFTDKWYELMQFLHENPKYMDEDKNQDYKNQYPVEEKWKYESVARMCLAYVDDAYFAEFDNNFDGWLKGTIPLLAGRHRAWFKDNEDSYDPEFVRYVMDRLPKQESSEVEEQSE